MQHNETNQPDSPTLPIYVSQTFPVAQADHAAPMLAWINARASQGYRVVDRRVLSSGGMSKQIDVLMVRAASPTAPATVAPAEGGA